MTDRSHFQDTKERYVIRVPKEAWFKSRGISTIPGIVWQEPKFVFRPRGFTLEHPKLKDKLIDEDVQTRSLESFIDNPRAPCVYGVSSEPTDSQALYFAAFLAYVYALKQIEVENERLTPIGDVHWERLYSGYRNPLIYEDGSINENIGLLILSNVTPEGTPYKMEKLRDILVAYAHIPRIVVVGGEDPITFFSTKLHHKMTHLFFNSGALVKRAFDVI